MLRVQTLRLVQEQHLLGQPPMIPAVSDRSQERRSSKDNRKARALTDRDRVELFEKLRLSGDNSVASAAVSDGARLIDIHLNSFNVLFSCE